MASPFQNATLFHLVRATFCSESTTIVVDGMKIKEEPAEESGKTVFWAYLYC